MFCTLYGWPKPNTRYIAVRETRLLKYTPHDHKREDALRIGPHLRKEKNQSHSFHLFVEAVHDLLAE